MNIIENIHECSLCGDSAVVECFDLGLQPMANKYPQSEQEKSVEFIQKMTALFCENCWSIHLPSEKPRSFFFEDYYYLSSVNKELVSHFQTLAENLKNHRFVVDVGSNDGILLRPLKKLGVTALGVDPSENVGALANAEGLETLVSFFDEKTANLIRNKYGSPDCIVASSVFTHMEDPRTFLRHACSLLANDGVIIVEVEYVCDIIRDIAFERFYFDRPHYFSLNSVMKMAEKEGLAVVDVNRINVHGGSIQLHLCKTLKNIPPSERVLQMLEKEAIELSDGEIKTQFSRFENAVEEFKEQLDFAKKNGKKVVGYGCPARLSTITNFGNIDSSLISAVVEDSPLKVGRFSPGKHIPLIKLNDAEEDVEIFIVFAYEYITSIKAKTQSLNCAYYKPIPFREL